MAKKTHKNRKFRFTNTSIKALKAESKTYECRDTSSRGLIVRITPSGAKSYYITYQTSEGTPKRYCLGAVQEYENPESARIAAGKMWDGIRNKGADPQAEKKERIKRQAQDATAHTLRTFIDNEYQEYAELHQRAGESAIKRLRGAFKDMLGTKIAAIGDNDLMAWSAKRLKKGNKPITINRYMDDLRSCLNHALDLGVITRHPFDDIPKKKKRLKTGDDKRVRYLGQLDDHEDIKDQKGNKIGERARLLKALGTKGIPAYMEPMVLLALHTGMRRSELFKLKWTDIDFKQQHIRLRAINTKSNKTRHAFLNEVTDILLRELRNAQGNVTNIDGLVFPNPHTGEPLTTVKKAWKTIVTEARLNDFRFHDCRHDFASQLVMKGVPLYTVAELLGHSGVEITQRYAHLAPRHKADAVAMLV